MQSLEVDLFKKIIRFDDKVKYGVDEQLNKLNDYFKIELTAEERNMIIKALGLANWYLFNNILFK